MNGLLNYVFAVFYMLFIVSICDGSIVVNTNNGKIRGKIFYDRKGREYYSFQSIPYAKPPLGALRFKAPEPVGNWDTILDATLTPPNCPQEHIIINNWVIGEENCLYLNVFTPKLPSGDNNLLNKSVMVFIHGGAFLKGSSRNYGPEFLMPEDVVLVTINYRLGLLGFLHMDDPKLGVPGNAGFKDQVLALKWVKDNIRHFGGNPNDITLFGESCGATSVHLHMLSPMSKGLFHKAILQSGSSLNVWAPSARNNGLLLAQKLNIANHDKTRMIEHFRRMPMFDLLKAQFNVNNFITITKQMRVGYVIEKPSSEPAFLSDEPINIIKSGNYNKVPMIIGHNSHEGILVEIAAMLRFSKFFAIRNVTKNLPYTLTQNAHRYLPEISEKVRNFYFKNGSDFDSTVRYLTDSWFVYDIYNTAIQHLKTSNESVHFYKFSANSKLNLCKYVTASFSEYRGASHLDDLGYLFTMLHTPARIEPNSLEDVSIDRMVKMWTNFAKYGNPTPDNSVGRKWEPFTIDSNNILEIGSQLRTWDGSDMDRILFWKSLYEKYLHHE